MRASILIPVVFAAGALAAAGCSPPAGGPAATSFAPSKVAVPVSDVAYSAADVAGHAMAADCWTIVAGNVYDVTSWLPVHPGGPAVIEAVCGRDGSGTFFNQHAGERDVLRMLAEFQVGYQGDSSG